MLPATATETTALRALAMSQAHGEPTRYVLAS